MKNKETIIKWIFTVLAFSSLLFLLGIVAVLFKEGLPLFNNVSPIKFLFGKNWYPTFDPPEYGILPLILASFWVTVGAMFICAAGNRECLVCIRAGA
jgi:phosphate transport system permease protein